MKFKRASGILLHPTSFPGRFGIGDLGPAAYQFIDWLAEAGCKLWQVLPLGPTGFGDSPYQCFSAFAGNPYLISPDFLLRDNLLQQEDLKNLPDFPEEKVDFGRVIPWKLKLLEQAFLRFNNAPDAVHREFEQFCSENKFWLKDYALFMALKEANGGGSWSEWPEQLRKRDKESITDAVQLHTDAMARIEFSQFLFFRQWSDLRAHVHHRGINVIGDIPIFVAYDSADVWANPSLFQLDDDVQPTVVAGVPPDYFSQTGQLWGNPLYRWDALRGNNFDWWIARFRAILQQVDIVRLDHFRGFVDCWAIQAGSDTAENGLWVSGPGDDFFKVIEEVLDDISIIAEDLGEITPDVIALRDQYNFPGMKILQFAFSSPDDEFLPHHFSTNCVVYTGTHDNETSRGWYESASEHERDFARRYLSIDGNDFAWDLIRAAWASKAVYAIAPMQDILNLNNEARMNFPSTIGDNWRWRMVEGMLADEKRGRLGELNYLYSR